MQILQIEQAGEKAQIAEDVLRTLPDWFGIESALQDYVKDSQTMLFWAALEQERPIGFVVLKPHNADTAEVYVMGVIPTCHRLGAGRRLIEHCQAFWAAQGGAFLTVKTLDASAKSDGYERTRAFYRGMGFRPLEVFPLLWDESNPCLLMAKSIL